MKQWTSAFLSCTLLEAREKLVSKQGRMTAILESEILMEKASDLLRWRLDSDQSGQAVSNFLQTHLRSYLLWSSAFTPITKWQSITHFSYFETVRKCQKKRKNTALYMSLREGRKLLLWRQDCAMVHCEGGQVQRLTFGERKERKEYLLSSYCDRNAFAKLKVICWDLSKAALVVI